MTEYRKNVVEFSSRSDKDIEQWIANFERKGEQGAPLYRQLLEERARRASARHKLDVEKSMALLVEAARTGTCTTYGALAAASDVPWTVARRTMDGASGHLAGLLDVCHSRALPLLTALCVNKEDVDDAVLTGPALKGFCAGARRLGHSFVDEAAFHREQRDASWAWGRTQRG